MGMGMDELLGLVKQSVMKHSSQQTLPGQGGFDPSALLGHISELFGQHKQSQGSGNVRPASEDPYGDPANEGSGRGDLFRQQRHGNVKPASQDPYGDPADEGGGR